MGTYAVSFKYRTEDRDAIKERRQNIQIPDGVKIVSGYRVLGETKGGLIVEGDHDGIHALVRQWRDLLRVRVTPLRSL